MYQPPRFVLSANRRTEQKTKHRLEFFLFVRLPSRANSRTIVRDDCPVIYCPLHLCTRIVAVHEYSATYLPTEAWLHLRTIRGRDRIRELSPAYGLRCSNSKFIGLGWSIEFLRFVVSAFLFRIGFLGLNVSWYFSTPRLRIANSLSFVSLLIF